MGGVGAGGGVAGEAFRGPGGGGPTWALLGRGKFFLFLFLFNLYFAQKIPNEQIFEKF